MKQFHLLDVLAHDLVIESEDENTKQGYFERPYQDPDSEGEFIENLPNRQSMQKLPRKELYIELFGVDATGTPIHLKVSGFRPYFYVGLQKKSDATIIKRHVLEKLKTRASIESDLSFEEVQRKVLFGYTGNTSFPMLKISMPSIDLFYTLRKLFLNKGLRPILRIQGRTQPVQVYEANLDPMLRFFHIQNLEPCGWIDAECDFELDEASGRLLGECDWSQVKSPAQKPGKSGAYKLAAWDIECYSPTGDFPVPEKDPVIQIGVVLVQQGKEPERHIFVNHTCTPVPGCIVHCQSKEDERAMLLDWAGWMAEQDADILVGYNIFGFDERYVWKRAQMLGIDQSAAFQALSRLEGEEVKLSEKMLSSSALGDNKLYIWTTPGRLQIDLYHYIRRLENLTSYKLDDVTSHYMSGKLKSIRQEGGKIILKTAITKEASVGRSVKLLDETGEAIGDKCIISAIAAGEITLSPQEPIDGIESAVKWAIVKDDVSPQEIFKLHRGTAGDRGKLAAYCIQDCVLVVELFNKLDVFNNAMSMANVCSVPVNYIFTRGQGIKIESLIFKECHQRGQSVLVLEAPGRNFNDKKVADDDEDDEVEDSYEGAIVFDPVPDYYFDAPVGVCDFASLYPSSIISENISYDTLLWVKDYDMSGNLVKTDWVGSESYVEPGTRWTEIEFDIWRPDPNDTRKHPVKIRAGVRVCRYAQYLGDRKGTLPDILQKLLAARKAKRKQAEKESDPFVKALLDAEQLAYKLTANSLYGQLGSATFKVRLQHLAASTTAYGRKQITFAKTAIEQFYGPAAGSKDYCAEIVYGDTDSLFVSFNPRGPDGKRLEGREALVRTIELTEECGRFVTQALKPPHDFEYDKVFWPFIIFSKKRYVGNKYEENPDEFKQTSMGIVLKRRDNAPIVKTIYGGAIQILLNQRNVASAAEFVRAKCTEMMAGNTSLGQLTITKSLKANYKDPTKIAHKVLADRIAARDPGNAPAPGDRIPYIYVQTESQVTLQGDRIELPSHIRAHQLKPDVRFYIEHQLTNPLSQLFSLRVEEIPGYSPPHSWPEHPDKRQVARERIAGDLLFSDTLRICERNERNKAATKMGFTVSSTGTSQRVRTVPIAAIPTAGGMTQTRMDAFIRPPVIIDESDADRILLESSAKQKKQKQKENGTSPKPKPKPASKVS